MDNYIALQLFVMCKFACEDLEVKTLQQEFKEIINHISKVDFEFVNGEPVVAPRSGKSCALVIGVAWKVFKATKEQVNSH